MAGRYGLQLLQRLECEHMNLRRGELTLAERLALILAFGTAVWFSITGVLQS
jgi:hypothetical protein